MKVGINEKSYYIAIGLMSGTSQDGIDASMIKTDGKEATEIIAHHSVPYPNDLKLALKAVFKDPSSIVSVERNITNLHKDAIDQLLSKANYQASDVDIIGFHGQTIYHDPFERLTWQVGDGALLACKTGIPVICDFRRHDIACGGQGAPLAPIYHQAIAKKAGITDPVVFVNIGGVSNITYIDNDQMIAFDTGPGNGLIDDYVLEHCHKDYDENGAIAAKGTVNETQLSILLDHPFFKAPPPKSLDRYSFDSDPIQTLAPEDAVATLTAFTTKAIAAAEPFLAKQPSNWYVTGGGRHNLTLMQQLECGVHGKVSSIEDLGVNGDMVEAEAFAYMAVRSLHRMPITFPGTTGVKEPMFGGAYYPA